MEKRKTYWWMVMYNWKAEADKQKWPEHDIFSSEEAAIKWIERRQRLFPNIFEYHIRELI